MANIRFIALSAAAAVAGASLLVSSFGAPALAKARAGSCGENMYWSTRMHKCMDARNGAPDVKDRMARPRIGCAGDKNEYSARCVKRRASTGGE